MPNWTEVMLECEGLSDLPIFTEFNGKLELDFNKIVPMPDYVRNTISPVRTNAVVNYLFSEFPEKEARAKIKEFDLDVDKNLLKKNAEEILSETNTTEYLGLLDNTSEISAYELGKNYVTSKETTGSWDWYNWAHDNWGVKWNASDTYLDGNTVTFYTPWSFPEVVFKKLSEKFPEKQFHSEIIFEDEDNTIYTIDFSSTHWDESSKSNPEITNEIIDSLEFQLGLYNQRNMLFPADAEEGKAYGIAVASYKDGEPYAICTVNLPNNYDEGCEIIGIKNAAYMDTNNYPWVTGLLNIGVATDTGFTKRSGFCEYPLYQFNEDWLKSLKPVDKSRTYDIYEKKYYQAMGIEINEKDQTSMVSELKEKYPEGTRIELIHMDGEDRMYSGLQGTVRSVDDIGQIHVRWDNGSSLAINTEVDSFKVIEPKKIKLAIRTATKNEVDHSFTQARDIMEKAGCIGHLRIDMGQKGNEFFTDWTDHIYELNNADFKGAFDTIINELRYNSEYENILSDRESMKNYCETHSIDALITDTSMPFYAYRVDSETYSCILRLDTNPGNYAAYIYAYNKENLDEHLDELANRIPISVLRIEPGKAPMVIDTFSDISSLQKEVNGMVECVYPWEDEVGIICNEEGKILGLPLNRALKDNDGVIYDIIAGPMLIVGLSEDNFTSLSTEFIEKYSNMFKEPEVILRCNGEFVAFPTSDFTKVPVYYENGKYAKEQGELTAFQVSYLANCKCKEAIEESIANNYSDNRLDANSVVNELKEKFGDERLNIVLANTCIEKSWDGRINEANVKWAKTIELPKAEDSNGKSINQTYVCNKPHIGLIDLVISRVRKGPEAKKEINNPAHTKKHEQER